MDGFKEFISLAKKRAYTVSFTFVFTLLVVGAVVKTVWVGSVESQLALSLEREKSLQAKIRETGSHVVSLEETLATKSEETASLVESITGIANGSSFIASKVCKGIIDDELEQNFSLQMGETIRKFDGALILTLTRMTFEIRMIRS